MIRKPYIGKPVITGDSRCCNSLHEKGTLGVIVNIDNIDCLRISSKNGETWWHCRKCLSPIKKVKK